MEEQPMNKGELSSELTGLNKGEKQRKKKQLMIGLSIGGGLLIVGLIILIVLLTTKDKKDDKTPVDKSLGLITCIYNVQIISKPILLISEEFILEPNNLEMYVDGEKTKYSKEYQFDERGNHTVQIKIYSDLNMDYMFKDIKDLISVEMISEKDCQINSMISTFENCEDLEYFNINGFKADKLKSMKKLFYKTSIKDFPLMEFNTIALEDMSYMFAYSQIESFSIGRFKI